MVDGIPGGTSLLTEEATTIDTVATGTPLADYPSLDNIRRYLANNIPDYTDTLNTFETVEQLQEFIVQNPVIYNPADTSYDTPAEGTRGPLAEAIYQALEYRWDYLIADEPARHEWQEHMETIGNDPTALISLLKGLSDVAPEYDKEYGIITEDDLSNSNFDLSGEIEFSQEVAQVDEAYRDWQNALAAANSLNLEGGWVPDEMVEETIEEEFIASINDSETTAEAEEDLAATNTYNISDLKEAAAKSTRRGWNDEANETNAFVNFIEFMANSGGDYMESPISCNPHFTQNLEYLASVRPSVAAALEGYDIATMCWDDVKKLASENEELLYEFNVQIAMDSGNEPELKAIQVMDTHYNNVLAAEEESTVVAQLEDTEEELGYIVDTTTTQVPQTTQTHGVV